MNTNSLAEDLKHQKQIINDSTPPPQQQAQRKKKSSGKKKSSTSYEHHLEQWLQNSSMNMDYLNEYNHLQNQQQNQVPAFNAINNNTQRNRHLLTGDPASLPSHFNAFDSVLAQGGTSSPSISSFLNFNAAFKQHYPYLQRQPSDSPQDPSSLATQQEFMSLPTSIGQALKNDKLATDQEKLNDVINSRRFNDLLDTPLNNNTTSNNSTAPLNESSVEEELEGDDTNSNSEEDTKPQKTTEGINNKTLLVNLLKQINALHETNSKIFRNLHETKAEMEALKYSTPSWGGLRHRRDSVHSISGLSVHSQPMGPMGYFGHNGTQSPAPTYHSQGNYTPGVVTDLIREVRDASRVRDESLLNKVRALIDEKSWTLNEANLRVLRDMEEIKIQIHNLKLDKQNTNDRISKLEHEVQAMRNVHGITPTNFMSPQQQHYSQHSHTQQFKSPPSQEQKFKRRDFNYQENFHDDFSQNFYPLDYQQPLKRGSLPFIPQNPPTSPPLSVKDEKKHYANEVIDEEEYEGQQLMQREKNTLQLRRDLQDALASKKHAESRILALEHMVTSLKSSPTNHLHSHQNNSLLSSDQQHLQMNGSRRGSHSMEQLSLNTNLNVPMSTTGKLMSPKPQKAVQVQTISPKNVLTPNIGPVTDL